MYSFPVERQNTKNLFIKFLKIDHLYNIFRNIIKTVKLSVFVHS